MRPGHCLRSACVPGPRVVGGLPWAGSEDGVYWTQDEEPGSQDSASSWYTQRSAFQGQLQHRPHLPAATGEQQGGSDGVLWASEAPQHLSAHLSRWQPQQP